MSVVHLNVEEKTMKNMKLKKKKSQEAHVCGDSWTIRVFLKFQHVEALWFSLVQMQEDAHVGIPLNFPPLWKGCYHVFKIEYLNYIQISY